MITVLHLIDDANVGGVTRGVADLTRRMGTGFASSMRSLPTHWRLAPRLRADVVVVDFTLSWAKLLFLLSLRLRFPGAVVIVEHSYTAAFERLLVPGRGRFRVLLRLCYRLADRVVPMSDDQAAWMRDAGLVRPGRLVNIPHAIDVEALTALPLAVRVPGPLRLGAYGRYAPQKGFDVLIEAMRQVPPEVATLDLAGYGEDEAALRQAAADLPHVRIHGPCDGPIGFLQTVDSVVIPSRWEAFGLVGLEARAAGRPVIASAVDGLIEQVEPDWGQLVPANDPAALAAAIRRMAGCDLGPLAAAARASSVGRLERKISAWRGLLTDLATIAQCEPSSARPSRSGK